MTSSPFKKVGVIGAGVMGSGIAAQVANAGIPVVLLDIVPDGAKDRSAIAAGAVARMVKTKPAPLMHKKNAGLITAGNVEDDLDKLSDCDWIVEVILEDPKVKAEMYARIAKVRRADAIVSSNTSTIPLAVLTKGMDADMAAHFAVTHFFNPPRYMRLLEVVGGANTKPEVIAALRAFGDIALGKNVITCKDTPGFIANRVGNFWIQTALLSAFDLGLTVEEADAIAGKPFGVPKTGIFALLDLVGLNLMPHVMKSFKALLPADDPFQKWARDVPLVLKMIEDGYTGRKGKGGFYRLNTESGKKVKESINLQTGDYAPSQKPALESTAMASKGLKALGAIMQCPDAGGEYARRIALGTLSYAARYAEEIAHSIVDVDDGMKDGYGWMKGPFELIDALGVDTLIGALKQAGEDVPPLLEKAAGKTFYRVENGKLQHLDFNGDYTDVVRPDGVLKLSDIKLATKPVYKNASAALWPIGDGVLCMEFTGKMNALDDQVMKAYGVALETIAKTPDLKALVIHNEGSNFSVGANLGLAMFAINLGLWDQIGELIKGGQQVFKALKYAPFPVVSAPSGMALGGGCETLLHSDAIVAHSETYAGLVEVGVGIIPGWGGCKEMLMRFSDPAVRQPRGPMPPVARAFEMIATAQTATSAQEAREMGILRKDDVIVMNRDRLLAEAKKKALELAENYSPPEERTIRLPGPAAAAALGLALRDFDMQGKITPHDKVVSAELARVLSGGDTDVVDELTEDDLLALEWAAFSKLARTRGTMARIEHMLETGKPLRN